MRIRCLNAAVIAALCLTTAPHAQSQPRPNIVMIMMDDMGYGDIGSYGVPDAKTPNIDRLARDGVRFTNYYANAANCSPTRTGLITGRYQQRYGIESPLTGPADKRELLPSPTSLPRLLKTAGYATGLIGKWHLGARVEVGPNRHGFDEFWGYWFGAIDYYSHDYPQVMADGTRARVPDLHHNEEPATAAGYLTDEFTDHAESFIEAHKNGPFFLEVSYNAVHWPFQAPDLPDDRRKWTDALHDNATRESYIAILERADRGVGRILNLLDRLQLTPNTLVVFTSDNGGEWLSRNAPLFHRKSTLWEGGIGVPLLMRWPGHITPGSTTSQVAITMDLTATYVALTGAQPPASYRPEGMNLMPLLQKPVERTLFWRISGPARTQKAVRRGKWKYIKDGVGIVDSGHELLFDLEADRGERNDLAKFNVPLLIELRGLVAKWEADVDAEAKQRSTTTTQADVTITPVIHSSIQLESAGKVIQIDPWSAGDLATLKPADLILVTDDPNHHLDVKAIERLRKPGAPVVTPESGHKQLPDSIVMRNGEARELAGVRIETTPAYDLTPGEPFHPKGEANGYIVTFGGKRIYIVGVTECLPEIRAAKDIDIAFFPLNLPLARMEPPAAIECIKAFKPKVVYPYHYDQEWVTRVGRGQPRGAATTRGLQELKTALESAGIEVRLAAWYPAS